MKELLKRALSTIILLPLILFFIIKGSFYLILLIIVSFLISVFEWHRMVHKTSYKLIGFIFLIFSFFSFYVLTINNLVLIPLFICISTDIGGFIFGKIFKGPKLSKISPNKTIAGAIGSLLLSSLVIVLLFYFINEKLNYLTIIVAMITSIFCQLGDLFFSFLKRKANLKNTGNFLPGHGGVLDRLDSILLGIPTGLFSFIIFF